VKYTFTTNTRGRGRDRDRGRGRDRDRSRGRGSLRHEFQASQPGLCNEILSQRARKSERERQRDRQRETEHYWPALRCWECFICMKREPRYLNL
jgi:hypothetical protein